MRILVLSFLLAMCTLQVIPCSWAHAMGLDQPDVEMHLTEEATDDPAALPDPEPEAAGNSNLSEWVESHAFLTVADWICNPEGLRRLGFFDKALAYRFDPGLAVERPPRA